MNEVRASIAADEAELDQQERSAESATEPAGDSDAASSAAL